MLNRLFHVLIVLFCMASACLAQETSHLVLTPIPPHSNANFGTVRVTLYDDHNNASKWILPIPHRVGDRNFWIANGISTLVWIADTENTQYCVHHTNGYEENPIFFSRHPSRKRMYAIGAPIQTLSMYLSWRAKRTEDAERAFGVRTGKIHWWAIPLTKIAAHWFGISFTIANTGR